MHNTIMLLHTNFRQNILFVTFPISVELCLIKSWHSTNTTDPGDDDDKHNKTGG